MIRCNVHNVNSLILTDFFFPYIEYLKVKLPRAQIPYHLDSIIGINLLVIIYLKMVNVTTIDIQIRG
jgi:hypothetical protein